MKRVIIVIVVLALIAVGWFAITRFREQRQEAMLSDFQTVRAERGDLIATVGATGAVRVNQTAILNWKASGTVDEILVMLGEEVPVDYVLANLEQTSLSQNIILSVAELFSAQSTLDDLHEPPSELELARAEQAIPLAEEAVKDAEQRLTNLNSPARQTDIDQAQANVILAGNKLSKAEEDFEPYANKPETNLTRAMLLSKMAQAQKEYDAVVRTLNNLLGTASELTLEIAETDLAVAQAQLKDAQEEYQRLKEGPDPEDIAAAEARVAAAQASLDLVQITVPFAGTITDIMNKPGDQVTPGAVAFRLDDRSRLFVDTQVSEVDINRIMAGQEVILTFDAILGKEYHGVVIEVALVGMEDQGVVDFTVEVELTDADEDVMPGMTAAVNVVVNRMEDVLLVPNRAVRVIEGERVVYVFHEGMLEPLEITLGANSETMSEVLEGDLKVGDEIVLNPPMIFEQQGPGMMGGP